MSSRPSTWLVCLLAAVGINQALADSPEPVLNFSDSGVAGGLKLALPGKNPSQRARAFVDRFRGALLPGDVLSRLEQLRVVASPFGRVVQLQQTLEGLPVYGKTLVVSEDRRGRTRVAVSNLGTLARTTRHSALAPVPVAIRNAESAFTSAGGRLRGQPRVETVWLLQDKNLSKVHLVTVPGAEPLGDFTYLVGGPEGRVGFVFRRSPMAQGYAYPNNPFRDDTWELVDLPYLTSSEHLAGEHVEVFNCTGSSGEGSCDSLQHLAQPDADGNYLIEPVGDNLPTLPDDAFVEVQAYYAINRIYDYFVGVGFSPGFIYVGVNYDTPASLGPNAMYSSNEGDFGGPAILMGQEPAAWHNIDLAVENDVIFHEYGHHVFGEVSSTGMFNLDDHGPVTHGMAINEATADYYSCSALEDPELGEYFASVLGAAYFPEGYMRKVDNTLPCPRGLYGEAHDDSMVFSGFLWDMRTHLGQAQADSFFLDVLAHFPGTVGFDTVTEVYLTRAAEVLDPADTEYAQTRAQERGLVGCERFIPLDLGGHTGFVYGKELLGGFGDMLEFIPGELHYFIELSENATSLEIDKSTQPYTDVDVVFLVREDQRIEHQLNMTLMQLESVYDFKVEADGVFDLLNPDPSTPFRPGHTYHLQAANRDDRTTEYSIQATVSEEVPDGGSDAGVDAGADQQADAGADPGPADAGGDPGFECPEGYGRTWDGEKWICVPECKDGFAPELKDGQWVCVSMGDDCGCATRGAGGLVPLVLLLGLALLARRFRG